MPLLVSAIALAWGNGTFGRLPAVLAQGPARIVGFGDATFLVAADEAGIALGLDSFSFGGHGRLRRLRWSKDGLATPVKTRRIALPEVFRIAARRS
jgi:hypothetical protein